MRSVEEIQLPALSHAQENHTARCRRHQLCAFTGKERDRCPVCHSSTTRGCEHQEFGGRPPSTRVCLCRRCGELFTSPTAFDTHQTLSGGCYDPSERGLEIVERTFQNGTWEMWACPGERPPGE